MSKYGKISKDISEFLDDIDYDINNGIDNIDIMYRIAEVLGIIDDVVELLKEDEDE